ncbi:hypothetical protein EV361DRAFT_1030583 [Lentinula raphanica]|nr:hypothetical protein EV361DRAFT_1030583 [Lentinula raphanica]
MRLLQPAFFILALFACAVRTAPLQRTKEAEDSHSDTTSHSGLSYYTEAESPSDPLSRPVFPPCPLLPKDTQQGSAVGQCQKGPPYYISIEAAGPSTRPTYEEPPFSQNSRPNLEKPNQVMKIIDVVFQDPSTLVFSHDKVEEPSPPHHVQQTVSLILFGTPDSIDVILYLGPYHEGVAGFYYREHKFNPGKRDIARGYSYSPLNNPTQGKEPLVDFHDLRHRLTALWNTKHALTAENLTRLSGTRSRHRQS